MFVCVCVLCVSERVGICERSYALLCVCSHPTRALLPYSQALLRFPAHIQQVDMESNGKRVTVDGRYGPTAAGLSALDTAFPFPLKVGGMIS